MNAIEAAAWKSFVYLIQQLLENIKADNYTEIAKNCLK